MREILFRGKCGYNNEWVEGFYYQAKLYRSDKELCHYITIPHPESDGQPSDHIMVHPETVGQFTSLSDKNGKRIFEGDIVRVCLDPEICVGNVIWDNKIASYNIPFNNGKCVLPLDIFIAKNKVGDKVWIEVIGNIHDNPELLENP